MAAIRYKELLGWYVITLKLRETVESRHPKKSTYASKIVPDHEPRHPKSEWVISIEKKLAQGRKENMPGSWAKLSIYRIPRHLKHGEDKAWVPQTVSLGPYHHGDEHLRHMEWHKWRCLNRILERSGQGIALYLDSVKKSERRARACYEERISMTCDEFVEMMVLDGCFMIEMFQGFAKGFKGLGYPPDDPVFSMRLIFQIQRDMIMLENQIPLFILNRLLGLQLGDLDRPLGLQLGDLDRPLGLQKERVTNLVLQFFSPLIGIPSFKTNEGFIKVMVMPAISCQRLERKVHCLEVVRRSLVHSDLKRPETIRLGPLRWLPSRKQLTYCLSDLREAGIKIKKKNVNAWGDIHFKNGILEIPSIEIHEGTGSLFLNLIAFEQSHFNCSNYVTSYVSFMHNLIKSPEHVLYLRKRRIIHHCLGSDAEVADLFHRLFQEVAFDQEDSYLCDLYNHLNAYYNFGRIPLDYSGHTHIHVVTVWDDPTAFLNHKWNAWKAILKNKYFDSPWSIVSLFAAFVLLVLTCIQSFYAVYAYYRPRS